MLKFIIILLISCNIFAVETGKFLGAKSVEKMPDWFKTSFLDFAEDNSETKENNKHLILYFHQDGCPYCEKLINESFKNAGLVKKLKQNFEVVALNMWGDNEVVAFNGDEFSEKQYAELLKVQFTPSLFFIDGSGNIVLRMDGFQSIEKMHKILDFVSAKKYQTSSFLSFSQNKNNGKLNSQNFFSKPPYILARNKKFPANKFLAVFFENGNCKECDEFHKNMLTKNNIKSAFEKMEVVQLNISKNNKLIDVNGNKTNSIKWYQDLKLTSTPAIVFFDKDGTEIIRKDGFFKEFHFDSILQYVLTNSYKTQTNFQRYIEHRADEIRATGKNVDLWKD